MNQPDFASPAHSLASAPEKKHHSKQSIFRALYRRYRKIGALLLGLVLCLLLALWVSERFKHITETDARVKADMVIISSRVGGWVAERLVVDGQTIQGGDELAQIDQRHANIKLDELRAKAAALRLRQERMLIEQRMTDTLTQDAISAAKARQSLATEQLAQASREFQRAEALLDHTVSKELWEQRKTQYQLAKTAQHTAKTALADALAKRADLAVLQKEDAMIAQENLQVLAQIHERELDLEDRLVRSPLTGIVDEKFVRTGEYVFPGQRLFIIHDPKQVWINADIKETKIKDLKPGQAVDIRVDAYPERHFSGRIERIGSAASAEFALLPSPNPSGNFTKITQRIPVRIAVAQPDDNPLRPGMMVEVDIDTTQP